MPIAQRWVGAYPDQPQGSVRFSARSFVSLFIVPSDPLIDPSQSSAQRTGSLFHEHYNLLFSLYSPSFPQFFDPSSCSTLFLDIPTEHQFIVAQTDIDRSVILTLPWHSLFYNFLACSISTNANLQITNQTQKIIISKSTMKNKKNKMLKVFLQIYLRFKRCEYEN